LIRIVCAGKAVGGAGTVALAVGEVSRVALGDAVALDVSEGVAFVVVVVDAVGDGAALSVIVAVTVEAAVGVADAVDEGSAVAVQVAVSVESVDGVDVLASVGTGVSLSGVGVALLPPPGVNGVSSGGKGVDVTLTSGAGVTAVDLGTAVGVALAAGVGVSIGACASAVNPTSELETMLMTRPAASSPLAGRQRRCRWVILFPLGPAMYRNKATIRQ
jgi:hypothetical protein